MHEAIIDAVTRIANHLNKSKGYLTSIKRSDVATVLEAEILLEREMEKYHDGTAYIDTSESSGHTRAVDDTATAS